MKKIFSLILLLSLFLPVFADITPKKYNNLPQGTFKKNWRGDIIQYDTSGKKIGVYKIQSRRYGKIK